MATWNDLVTFVRREYQVLSFKDDEIRILFEFEEDGRSQVMVLAHEVLDKREDWVQIASPCGKVAQVNLERLLEEIGLTTIVGGAAIMGEWVVIRHSLPLVNLDINEFIDPLELVAGAAELLEQQFTGRDDY